MPRVDAGKHFRSFSLLGMTVSLIADRRELIDVDEYFLGKGAHLHSLLSNFHRIEELPFVPEPDVALYLEDDPTSPFSFRQTGEGRYLIRGALRENERRCRDKRSCIFGNMGLFSKLLVGELERRGIFSLHSTSFYDRKSNRLYLVIGGSGSGKSTVLLKAITLGGIEVFGTELTHFSFVGGRTKLLKGSLWQNCRMGNLVFDFPELMVLFRLERPAGDPWHSYKSVSLHGFEVPEIHLEPASIIVVMPRIEGERSHSSISLANKDSLALVLFQNLSDKVSPPGMLWGTQFVPSLDSPDRQAARMVAAKRFLDEAPISECWNVLASPSKCLDGIFPSRSEGCLEDTLATAEHKDLQEASYD